MLALEEHFHFSHISAIIWRKLWLGEEKLKNNWEKKEKYHFSEWVFQIKLLQKLKIKIHLQQWVPLCLYINKNENAPPKK